MTKLRYYSVLLIAVLCAVMLAVDALGMSDGGGWSGVG
jgi:hypothetical protein